MLASATQHTEPLNDMLSNRKYLVADYNPKQTHSDFQTTSSIVNTQSDFSAAKTNCTTRLLGRNSIVPLVTSQSTPAQRRQTILMDTSMQNQSINQRNSSCQTPPPVIFLFVTLLFTVSATGFLSFAVMSDHWEIIKWDRHLLEHLSNKSMQKTSLQWHLDDRVARIAFTRHGKTDNIFLVPMHGGIWTLCIDLTDADMRQLGRYGFPHASKCISYLAESIELSQQHDEFSMHGDYQMARRPSMRMHNLSISCSLVCLIILGSAALLGAFGIFQRQISAILVTGVMYLLAALFALFTLMIVHFKRHQSRPLTEADFDGALEGFVAKHGDARIAQHLLSARLFMTSWSLDLGWGGVVMCGITYVLWIMLSKIMRYNPLSALLI